MTDESETASKQPSAVAAWAQRNWFGIAALLIGLAFSTYFYLESRAFRLPLFRSLDQSVISAPTNIEGVPVQLVFTDTGEPVEGFLIEQRFVFQNAGNLSIRPEHITLPLRIRIGPDGARVLSARVSAATRDDIIQPTTQLLSDSSVGLSFAILEGGDAFEIAVIMVSEMQEVDAQIEGAVEGAREITSNTLLTPSNVFAGVLLLIALGIFGGIAYDVAKSDTKPTLRGFIQGLGAIVLVVTILGGGIFALLFGLAAIIEFVNPAATEFPAMLPVNVGE
jgi:hypothetical protein